MGCIPPTAFTSPPSRAGKIRLPPAKSHPICLLPSSSLHKGKISGVRVRALARDIFIYDLQNFDTLLGGLVLTTGVTNANFYAMVGIIINASLPGPFILQDENGTTVAQGTQPLLPGRYFVVADGTVQACSLLLYRYNY
ncbi:hypothetical protein B0T25DRAFT_628158 [Lasiosphaeria hispida]|uniref:DUF7881 domain-containing protein n=1 Tax=Lasiosphaeria hispida TaxID=260671 RepID=A0AAJ0ML61_9PEZI|nr:hypothetical protein B0T25DRAFT_628158 [Lasiosphaeria hispida]